MKRVVSESKILQMPLRVKGVARNFSLDKGQEPLSAVLSGLRAEFDGLSIRLAREYGVESPVVLRAEQIANAVQRLEWALDREDGGSSAS